MANSHTIGHPRHHHLRHWPPDVRDVFSFAWRLLWALIILAGAVLALARLARNAFDSATAGPASNLQGGYTGPPVRVTLSGSRTRSLDGVCLAIVRDGSDSVARQIDPSGQVNRELTAVAEALATSGSNDLLTAIVFAEHTASSDLAPAGSSTAAQVLLGSSALGSGTNFDAAFAATATQLAHCPAGAQPHVLLVSDGVPSGDPAAIATGLARLPPQTRISLLALDLGEWARVAPLWGPPHDIRITPITRLHAGVVARAAATVVEDATGQHLHVSFQP